VRLDTGNRSFLALVGAGLAGLWLVCGAVACVLVSLIAYRIADDGLGALTSGADLWPALALALFVGAGAAFGVWSLRRQIVSSLRLARRVDELQLPLPEDLDRAAWRAGLAGRLVLVDSEESFSFTFCAVTPRVAVSRGLVASTSPRELDAVLEHERYHVRNLDPLKVVLARALPATFFYLPALRELRARYIAGRELAADRSALESCGRTPLAGALLKVVRGPRWPELGAAAAIGGPELLDVRVAQLETGFEPRVGGVSVSALLLSLVGIAALTAAFVVTVVGVGGPDAVARETGASLQPTDVALALLCAVPWVIGGFAIYRSLDRRAKRSLTRHPRSTTFQS
jgi:Zn-dependent protease with chaperone function